MPGLSRSAGLAPILLDGAMDAPGKGETEMKRKLSWLALVVALAAPAAVAWAGEGKAGGARPAGEAGDPPCCCWCSKTCSR